MKLLQLLVILMFFGFAFAAPTLCYQESANVSTVCGGLATGYYNTGLWAGMSSPENATDGNWSTGTADFPFDAEKALIINYTIPEGTLNALWQIKWISGDNATDTQNFTISPYCHNSSGNYSLIINIMENETAGYMGFGCLMDAGNWNYTGMMTRGNPSNVTNYTIFEEAIWWNISNVDVPTFASPTNTTYNAPDFNLNFTCIGDAAGWLYNISIAGTPLRINNYTANNSYNLISMSAADAAWYANLTCANDTMTLSNSTAVYWTIRSSNLPTIEKPDNTTYTSTGQNNMPINVSCIGALDAYLSNVTVYNLSGPTGNHILYTDYPFLNDSYYNTTHFLQDNAYEIVVTCVNDTFSSSNTSVLYFTVDVNATRFYTETVYWNINHTISNGTVSTPLLDSIFSDTGSGLTTISMLIPLFVLALVGGFVIFYMTTKFGREET